MNKVYPVIVMCFCFIFSLQAQQTEKTEILLIGFDHLSQLDNGTATSNVFSEKKQKEILKLTEKLQQYDPDMIMVEYEPAEQSMLDSLYKRYRGNELRLSEIENGASETYQVGFRLAKQLNLRGVYGIDHYESTSQSLLSNGDHIGLFKDGLTHLINTARPLKEQVREDSLSIYQYIRIMNQPEFISMTHRLIYNLPAYVMNGTFSDSGTNTVDIGQIDERYIGAEYITLFYNRNLKIYSNILNAQLLHKGKRLILFMGQLHIGVLQDLFEDNPDYEIVDAMEYLN